MNATPALLFVTPQIRSRESYLLELLSEIVPVSVLSLYPPYRPIESQGPFPMEQHLVRSWKWLWPAEQWVGDWTSHLPGSCSFFLVQELRKWKSQDQSPKWIWFSGASMAGVVREAQNLGYRVIVDEDRMPSSQLLRDVSRHWSHWIQLPEAWRDQYYERRRCERAHAVITSSSLHAARTLKLAPQAKVRVLSHAVHVELFSDLLRKEGSKLLFCGDLGDPIQQEGIRWFADEILPRLHAAVKSPRLQILIAGPSATQSFLKDLTKLEIETLTWDKNDSKKAFTCMKQCLSEAMICFIPHRKRNAGFQFLLQSMAAGRPVVSTTAGTEGLLFTPGREVWIDDQPDDFTSKLLRLIRTPELRTQTRQFALETLRSHYDWVNARETLSKLLTAL